MYYGYSYDWTYILVIIGTIITLIAQFCVNSNYNKYKNRRNTTGISGREVARKILDANGLADVTVSEVAGTLTDHYDPSKKRMK